MSLAPLPLLIALAIMLRALVNEVIVWLYNACAVSLPSVGLLGSLGCWGVFWSKLYFSDVYWTYLICVSGASSSNGEGWGFGSGLESGFFSGGLIIIGLLSGFLGSVGKLKSRFEFCESSVSCDPLSNLTTLLLWIRSDCDSDPVVE